MTLVDAVPIVGAPAPRSAQVVARLVDGGFDEQVNPIGSARGTPPDFAEAYASGEAIAGSFVSSVEGVTVTERCDGPVETPDRSVELMLVVTTGPAGSKVDRIDVSYGADGREYRDTADWTAVLCADGPELVAECAEILDRVPD